MSCNHTQGLLQAYVDGELELSKALEVEAHIQTCTACSQASKHLVALRAALHDAALHFNAPPSLQARVGSALRKVAKVEGRPSSHHWRWLSAGAAAAFALVLTWSIVPLLSNVSQHDILVQQVVASHVRSLMADHITDINSSDRHTVKPWFNGKLDFSPPVNDLNPQGFPLLGGRLDYLDNRSVAALVYRHRGHFINLFIWPSSSLSDMAAEALEQQGYHVLHWRQSGMNYWAVSELNERELQEFAQQVRSGA
jgi:anti-sigma factor RsiW